MANAFRLPDPGEGIHEAEILEVYVSAGDEVQEDDLLLYIETDKAAVEIPSPFSGVIEEVRVKQGDVVEVGTVLLTYQEGAHEKTVDTERESPTQSPNRKEGNTAEDTQQADDTQDEQDTKETRQEDVGSGEKRGRWTGETKAPQKKPQQDQDKQAATAESAKEKNETHTKPSPDRPVPAAPTTRRLARELHVDLREVSGSGPGSRVTAEDVRAFAGQSEKGETESQPKEPREPAAAKKEFKEKLAGTSQSERRRPLEVQIPELLDFSRWGPIEQEPLKSIRRATAKRMSIAWSQIPHVTHQDVADITELEAFRQRHSEEVTQQEGSLSLTVFVLRALAATLKQFPRFNASLDPQAGQIILKRYYHIGVAVDTDRGLIVPVVRDVDRKSVVELSKELSQLVERVRSGDVKPDDVQGGTFTLTNPGPLGGTTFTPIINYPEVAILGLARARLEPVVQGDLDRFSLVPRLRLPVHLTFDHRVNDGADAARFISRLIEILQEPDQFLLNV